MWQKLGNETGGNQILTGEPLISSHSEICKVFYARQGQAECLARLSCGLGSNDSMQYLLHSIKAVVSKVCAPHKFTGCEN